MCYCTSLPVFRRLNCILIAAVWLVFQYPYQFLPSALCNQFPNAHMPNITPLHDVFEYSIRVFALRDKFSYVPQVYIRNALHMPPIFPFSHINFFPSIQFVVHFGTQPLEAKVLLEDRVSADFNSLSVASTS